MFDDECVIDPEEMVWLAASAAKVLRAQVEEEARKKAEAAKPRVNPFAKYRDDPIGFFKEVLGIEPWESEDPNQDGQGDLIRDINEVDFVGCASGQKTGKSTSACGVALWWVVCASERRCFLTAPSFPQVKDILWKEMTRIFQPRREGDLDANGNPLPPPYRDSLEVLFDCKLPLDPATGIKLKDGNDLVGKSTDTPQRMQGISSQGGTLFVIDESSGFADAIFESVLGNTAGGGKIFAISNPNQPTGWFFNLFIDRPKEWRLRRLNSENTPNVVHGKPLVPGLAKRERIMDMRASAGPDYKNNPFYMVRVLGLFPPQGTNTVISMVLVERGREKWRPDAPPELALLALGVDVAREGDDVSVIYPVRGHHAYTPTPVARSLSADGYDLAGEVIRIASEMRISDEQIRVNLDGNGVGAALYDALRRSDAVGEGWLQVSSLIVGEKADTEDQHVNLRSQLWFGARDWLAEGGKVPKHDRTMKELCAAKYSYDNRGRFIVEPKKIMKAALGGKSPDYADALCLAVYRGPRGAGLPSGELYTAAPDPRHASNAQDAWDD